MMMLVSNLEAEISSFVVMGVSSASSNEFAFVHVELGHPTGILCYASMELESGRKLGLHVPACLASKFFPSVFAAVSVPNFPMCSA
jgi:hypothetical protein